MRICGRAYATLRPTLTPRNAQSRPSRVSRTFTVGSEARTEYSTWRRPDDPTISTSSRGGVPNSVLPGSQAQSCGLSATLSPPLLDATHRFGPPGGLSTFLPCFLKGYLVDTPVTSSKFRTLPSTIHDQLLPSHPPWRMLLPVACHSLKVVRTRNHGTKLRLKCFLLS